MLLDALVEAGIDPSRMMPGTGCCSITDTVRLTAEAVKHGCAGVLMLPPFYYKGVSEEGLFRYFSEVVERVGDARLRIYLYHIPPVAVVGITTGLVERLLAAYPDTIAGMKDSSGDWNNTKTFLDAFAKSGFDVFVGSESFLLAGLRNGAVGTFPRPPTSTRPRFTRSMPNGSETPHGESATGPAVALRRSPIWRINRESRCCARRVRKKIPDDQRVEAGHRDLREDGAWATGGRRWWNSRPRRPGRWPRNSKRFPSRCRDF